MSFPLPKIIDNFLLPEKCQYFIDTYKNKVVRSTVVNSNGTFIDNSRTSSTYFLPENDTNVIELKNKVSEFLKCSKSQIEGIQFLRYMKGEKYTYHHDYISSEKVNQRIHTIIVYLNTLDPKDGGATSFFHYKMKVNPIEGRAAWFINSDENGILNNESLHSGEEILTDTVKYALNIWTRQK